MLVSPQPDRTYDLKIGQPTVSYFLKQAAGIAKGAEKPGETCCCSEASAPIPDFILLAHPVMDICRPLGSVLSFAVIDVIFMAWGNCSRSTLCRKENYEFPPLLL